MVTYLFGHVVVAGSVHVIIGPLEERRLHDRIRLPVAVESELFSGFASEGVIKGGSLDTHIGFFILFKI